MPENNNYGRLKQYNHDNYTRFTNLHKFFLSGTPIKEFSFQRFYPGGYHLSLFSHPEYLEYYFCKRMDLGPCFYKNINSLKQDEAFFFLWPKCEGGDEVFLMLRNYHILGGLSIYLRREECIDTYHFSGDQDDNMNNFYLNNIPLLKYFMKYFQENAVDILSISGKNVLGRHTGKYVFEGFGEHQKKAVGISFLLGGKNIHLTQQESRCLELLSAGFSIKAIARQLEISPRTVETHIATSKRKTQTFSRDALVEFYHCHKIHGGFPNLLVA